MPQALFSTLQESNVHTETSPIFRKSPIRESKKLFSIKNPTANYWKIGLKSNWQESYRIAYPKFTRTFSALSKKLATAVGGYRMVRNILDLCKIADDYIAYLKDKGMKFGEDGFPVFSQQMFLDDLPEQVIPYDFKKNRAIKNPTKTLLCFYCPNARIYPRLEQVLDDIAEYRKYMGTVATDVTMTCDMDEEWQDFIMLLNQLFMAVLAVNRIKIVANLRTGNLHTHGNFKGIPANIMWAAGFLGKGQTMRHALHFYRTACSTFQAAYLRERRQERHRETFADGN